MSGFAFLFPGQGSHYVGMGKALYEAFPAVRRLFQEGSDVTGLNLKTLCFDGPEATLVRTDHVQPAITLVNVACLEVLREEGVSAAAVAGHSLGEYAALHAADACTFADAMRLVAVRGRAMQDAAERHPGGMLAVFGLDIDAAEAVCEEVVRSGAGVVQVANQNSPQQVALTGDSAGVKAAAIVAKQRGSKLQVPLKVSGPWHSRFMADAQPAMRDALAQVTFRAPSIPVIANVSAQPYPAEAAAISTLLVEQLVSPVLWARSMNTLLASGFSHFFEVGPGKVLTGLMRDINREARGFPVQDLETLQKFRDARASLPA